MFSITRAGCGGILAVRVGLRTGQGRFRSVGQGGTENWPWQNTAAERMPGPASLSKGGTMEDNRSLTGWLLPGARAIGGLPLRPRDLGART